MAHKGFLPSERAFALEQRVLRFNSLTNSEEIHSVPLCFAFDGQAFFFHAKRAKATRWRNIKVNNTVSLELDAYSDNWSELKGVLIFGNATFLKSGQDYNKGLALLKSKYPQYGTGPAALDSTVELVKVVPTRVTSWYLEGNSIPRFGSYT